MDVDNFGTPTHHPLKHGPTMLPKNVKLPISANIFGMKRAIIGERFVNYYRDPHSPQIW